MLVDLYKGFDENMFSDDGGRRSEIAGIYSAFLEDRSDLLEDALSLREFPIGASQLVEEALYTGIGGGIDSVGVFEKGYSSQCCKPNYNEMCKIPGFEKLKGNQSSMARAGHIARMVMPGEFSNIFASELRNGINLQYDIVRAFGLEAIEYFAGSDYTRKQSGLVADTIGLEGDGVRNFWTLAPYIHDGLKEEGVSPGDSIKTIWDIVLNSFTGFRESYEVGCTPLFLYGFTERNLGLDERMPSHLLARLQANRDVWALREGSYQTRIGREIKIAGS